MLSDIGTPPSRIKSTTVTLETVFLLEYSSLIGQIEKDKFFNENPTQLNLRSFELEIYLT